MPRQPTGIICRICKQDLSPQQMMRGAHKACLVLERGALANRVRHYDQQYRVCCLSTTGAVSVRWRSNNLDYLFRLLRNRRHNRFWIEAGNAPATVNQ